jgi:hypothetical protein
MPPKRATARPSGPARRGRSSTRGRGRGGKTQDRLLSDISEESISQAQAQSAPERLAPILPPNARGSNKRTFAESAGDQDSGGSPAKRETRASTAKLMKLDAQPAIEQSPQKETQQPAQETAQEVHQDQIPATATAETFDASPQYTPSLELLFFVHLGDLDTDADTESLTLNLIDLMLAQDNWHPGLSGLVQLVARFLIASILTRKQNLIENVAASVEMFGLEYEQLVEGYRLLWEWKENMSEAVGIYAERLAELPDSGLLLGQGVHEDNYVGWHEAEAELNARPEPERSMEAAGA